MNYRAIIPFKLRKFVLKFHQKLVWRKAIRKFINSVESGSNEVDDLLLKRLIYGWGNQGFSANVGYLRTCIQFAKGCQKPVLECGSGLSTILIGIILAQENRQLISLENSDEWASIVAKAMVRVGVQKVGLHVGPLKNYGDFTWYNTEGLDFKENFGLIICDGPPAQTEGGRYGLVPILGKYIDRGTIILMDDTQREDERQIINRWNSTLQFTTEFKTDDDHHAILRIK